MVPKAGDWHAASAGSATRACKSRASELAGTSRRVQAACVGDSTSTSGQSGNDLSVIVCPRPEAAVRALVCNHIVSIINRPYMVPSPRCVMGMKVPAGSAARPKIRMQSSLQVVTKADRICKVGTGDRRDRLYEHLQKHNDSISGPSTAPHPHEQETEERERMCVVVGQ